MSQPKEILLISYAFPPASGIGGRRWGKFTKYLSKAGHKIHVITTQSNPKHKPTFWTESFDPRHVIRHEIPSGYPELKPATTFLRKIRNRLTLWRLKASTQGTIYDKSIFWHAKVLNYARILLSKHPITHVIVSGAPFHMFYYLSKLKEIFPRIHYVLDYRDPWTNSVNYGIQALSSKRLEFEQNLEQKALQKADLVMGPTDPRIMVGSPIEESGTHARIVELAHAFDPDDLPKVLPTSRVDGTIRLIYGGALYVGVDQHLRQLSLALDGLQESHPDLYQKLDIRIYTRQQQYHSLLSDRHLAHARFFPTVSPAELFQQIAEADICLMFLSYHNKHYLTTKFYEFATLRKPFLLMGEKGKAAAYIEENNLGIALDKDEITTEHLAQSLLQLTDSNIWNQSFPLESFSFEARTQELIQLLTKSPLVSNLPTNHG